MAAFLCKSCLIEFKISTQSFLNMTSNLKKFKMADTNFKLNPITVTKLAVILDPPIKLLSIKLAYKKFQV